MPRVERQISCTVVTGWKHKHTHKHIQAHAPGRLSVNSDELAVRKDLLWPIVLSDTSLVALNNLSGSNSSLDNEPLKHKQMISLYWNSRCFFVALFDSTEAAAAAAGLNQRLQLAKSGGWSMGDARMIDEHVIKSWISINRITEGPSRPFESYVPRLTRIYYFRSAVCILRLWCSFYRRPDVYEAIGLHRLCKLYKIARCVWIITFLSFVRPFVVKIHLFQSVKFDWDPVLNPAATVKEDMRWRCSLLHFLWVLHRVNNIQNVVHFINSPHYSCILLADRCCWSCWSLIMFIVSARDTMNSFREFPAHGGSTDSQSNRWCIIF